MKKLLVILFLISLSTSSFAKVYDHVEGNKLTLIEDPKISIEHKIELIRKAKHHINILTFFWDDSSIPDRLAKELSKANGRGVEVRILATFIPTIGTDFLGKGRKNLKAQSSAVFTYQTLTPGRFFSITHNLHEKIFSVDGEIAIIGGRNISDSSLSGKDIEIQLEGPVVNQVQDHFKRMFDFVLDLKIKTNCVRPEDSLKCEENYNKLKFGLSDKNFFPEQALLENGDQARIITHEGLIHHYENKMNKKQRLIQQDDILDTVTKIEFKKLRAYNYFLMPTQRYRDFLDQNLAAGNSIEMITNSMESAKFSSNWGYFYSIPDALDLSKKGLEIYQWERNQKFNYVHEKVLIFDEDHVVLGSHNFATGSTAVSNEIVVEFTSKGVAQRLIDVFENEKSNISITKKVDAEFLQKELDQNARKIKYIRSKPVSRLLKEIY